MRNETVKSVSRVVVIAALIWMLCGVCVGTVQAQVTRPSTDAGQPHTTSLIGCVKTPASLLVCIEAGVVSLSKVAARYTGKGKGKDLVNLLQKWGGKLKPGGKGSHVKVQMPSGRMETVPLSPAPGTARGIIKRALEEAR